jgi:hypothetical protein
MASRRITLALVAIDFILAASCSWEGDKARAWYWCAAGNITLSTLWIK